MTTNTRDHELTAAQSFHAFQRAVEDGRWLDACTFATVALTLHDAGYGGQLPKGALTEMVETRDVLSREGVQVTPL